MNMNKTPHKKEPNAPATRGRALRVIAAFKFIKGLLLVVAGIGAIKVLHKDIADVATHWIEAIRIDPDNRHVHGIIVKLGLVDDRRLEELSVGSFFYAALFLTEGVGLWMKKRWAEYFTVIVTCSLMPIEIYELVVRVTITRIAVILINVSIVWYLIRQLRKGHT